MLRAATFAAASAMVAAQGHVNATWYGLAPDVRTRGSIDFFEMTPTGRRVRPIASIPTKDNEYPKVGTLKCEWGANTPCWFLTGVESQQIEDSLYSIDKTTGAVLNKFSLPAGIYTDNLAMDWNTTPSASLYFVAFDPKTRNAGIVDITGGKVNSVTNITTDLRGAFVFPSNTAICAETHTLYVFADRSFESEHHPSMILAYDLSGATGPKLLGEIGANFPAPGGIHAFCNASGLLGITATTLNAPGFDRLSGETGVVGAGKDRNGRDTGFLVPITSVPLPPRAGRRDPREIQLSGLVSEFDGVQVVGLYPEFIPGEPFSGFLWTSAPFDPRPLSVLTPSEFFIAGIAAVPAQ